MPAFADLADLPEDERIRIIGETATHGHVIAFIVDDNEKADRYLRKLEPYRVRVIARGSGPVKGTIAVRIGPPES